jgi:hypothetical protein
MLIGTSEISKKLNTTDRVMDGESSRQRPPHL